MTEADAKTKWCPMFRFVDEPESHAAYNACGDKGGERTHCIGSACMMWRDHGPFAPDYKPMPHEIGGFCGLAGRP